MPKIGDLLSMPPKILAYGPPGTGKTALGLTLGAKLQVVDFDRGLRTGLQLKDKFTETRKQVDFVPFYEDDPTKGNAFGAGLAYIQDVAAKCKAKTYPFQALMVDSLTTVAEAAQRAVQATNGIIMSSVPTSTKPKGMEIQHWGLTFSLVEQFIFTLRTLPILVYMTAHQHKDDDGEIMLSMSGQKTVEKIPSWFDEVWYFKLKPGAGTSYKYTIQTKANDKTLARSRDNLDNDIEIEGKSLEEILAKGGYEFPKVA